MALAQPVLVTCKSGQDVAVVITLTTYQSIASWTVAANVRAYNGGPILFSGTATPTDTGTVASWSIAFAASDTAKTPGAYVWEFDRTNAGANFPICDDSTFRITAGADTASPTLTNLSELWAHLKYTPSGVSTTDDPRYKQDLQILLAAEAFVKRHCGRRQFIAQTYTEYFDAPVKGNLWLKETPIQSITSIKFDATGGYGQLANTFDSTTLLDGTTDYYFRIDGTDGFGYAGELFATRPGGWGYWYWPSRGWPFSAGAYTPGLLSLRPASIPGAFQVIYVGGYTLIPDDLKLAIWQIVADRRAAAALGNVMTSESMEGYSYSLGAPDAEIAKIGSVMSLLAAYRRGDAWVG